MLGYILLIFPTKLIASLMYYLQLSINPGSPSDLPEPLTSKPTAVYPSLESLPAKCANNPQCLPLLGIIQTTPLLINLAQVLYVASLILFPPWVPKNQKKLISENLWPSTGTLKKYLLCSCDQTYFCLQAGSISINSFEGLVFLNLQFVIFINFKI